MSESTIEIRKGSVGIEDVKTVLRWYLSQGYTGGCVSSFLRDVVLALRDIPDAAPVKEDLGAAVRRLVGR